MQERVASAAPLPEERGSSDSSHSLTSPEASSATSPSSSSASDATSTSSASSAVPVAPQGTIASGAVLALSSSSSSEEKEGNSCSNHRTDGKVAAREDRAIPPTAATTLCNGVESSGSASAIVLVLSSAETGTGQPASSPPVSPAATRDGVDGEEESARLHTDEPKRSSSSSSGPSAVMMVAVDGDPTNTADPFAISLDEDVKARQRSAAAAAKAAAAAAAGPPSASSSYAQLHTPQRGSVHPAETPLVGLSAAGVSPIVEQQTPSYSPQTGLPALSASTVQALAVSPLQLQQQDTRSVGAHPALLGHVLLHQGSIGVVGRGREGGAAMTDLINPSSTPLRSSHLTATVGNGDGGGAAVLPIASEAIPAAVSTAAVAWQGPPQTPREAALQELLTRVCAMNQLLELELRDARQTQSAPSAMTGSEPRERSARHSGVNARSAPAGAAVDAQPVTRPSARLGTARPHQQQQQHHHHCDEDLGEECPPHVPFVVDVTHRGGQSHNNGVRRASAGVAQPAVVPSQRQASARQRRGSSAAVAVNCAALSQYVTTAATTMTTTTEPTGGVPLSVEGHCGAVRGDEIETRHPHCMACARQMEAFQAAAELSALSSARRNNTLHQPPRTERAAGAQKDPRLLQRRVSLDAPRSGGIDVIRRELASTSTCAQAHAAPTEHAGRRPAAAAAPHPRQASQSRLQQQRANTASRSPAPVQPTASQNHSRGRIPTTTASAATVVNHTNRPHRVSIVSKPLGSGVARSQPPPSHREAHVVRDSLARRRDHSASGVAVNDNGAAASISMPSSQTNRPPPPLPPSPAMTMWASTPSATRRDKEVVSARYADTARRPVNRDSRLNGTTDGVIASSPRRGGSRLKVSSAAVPPTARMQPTLTSSSARRRGAHESAAARTASAPPFTEDVEKEGKAVTHASAQSPPAASRRYVPRHASRKMSTPPPPPQWSRTKTRCALRDQRPAGSARPSKPFRLAARAVSAPARDATVAVAEKRGHSPSFPKASHTRATRPANSLASSSLKKPKRAAAVAPQHTGDEAPHAVTAADVGESIPTEDLLRELEEGYWAQSRRVLQQLEHMLTDL